MPGGPRISMSYSAATAPSRSGVVSASGHGEHEPLEAGGRAGDEAASAGLAHAIRVRDPEAGEEELACRQRHLGARLEQRHVAVEQVEALVVGVVDVQRRHRAGGHVEDLHEAEVAGGGVAVRVDAGAAVEELDVGRHGVSVG